MTRTFTREGAVITE